MRERPILFSGEMVRAIFDGRKTVTRRPVKPQPPSWCDKAGVSALTPPGQWEFRGICPEQGAASVFVPCPYLPASETRLWVRETWAPAIKAENRQIAYAADGRWCSPSADGQLYFHGWVQGVTDKTCADWQNRSGHWVGRSYFDKWRPSIHMPRWASRITLQITGVRVERLQDIEAEDCIAEGIPEAFGGYDMTDQAWRLAFQIQWDKLYGKSGYGWESNPWVWRIAFRRVEEK